MRNKLIALVAGLAIIVGGIFAYFMIAAPAQAANCNRDAKSDTNSIINNGACTTEELSKKYNENKSGDLPAIFRHYFDNRVPANFNTAKEGKVLKNGDVVVDGKVVATDAQTVGRHNYNNSKSVKIGGKTYYQGSPEKRWAPGVKSMQAFVYFDQNGEFKAAVLKSCGNPVEAKPKPKVSYECDGLTASKIDRTRYDLSVSTSQHRATFKSVTFNVYDSNGDFVKSKESNSKTYRYTQNTPGEYTIKAAVTFETYNGKTKTTSEGNCVTKITVEEEPCPYNPELPIGHPDCEEPKKPVYDCDALNASLIGEATDRAYKYDLEYTAENGAELQSVDFNFGDGNSKNGVTPSELNDVTHTYAEAGDYTTTATLKFNVDDEVKNANCEVNVTASPDKEEPCPYNPELPVGHPDCEEPKEECPENPELPADSKDCGETPVTPEEPETPEEPKGKGKETPETIPETGAGSLIGAFAGLGSIGAASYYYVMSRRELLGKIFNR